MNIARLGGKVKWGLTPIPHIVEIEGKIGNNLGFKPFSKKKKIAFSLDKFLSRSIFSIVLTETFFNPFQPPRPGRRKREKT